jgi:GNAT superfamily N-acetyltransferase
MPDWIVENLAAHHDRGAFDCGNQNLTDWFRYQAGQFEKKDLARTYVLVSASQTALVGGYYSISTCQIRYEELPSAHSKGLPRRLMIPAVLLGKLAVDKSRQGQGLGSALLMHTFQRVLHPANEIGIRVVMVDAIDGSASDFYLKQGFIAMPDHPNRLFIPVHVIRALGLDPLSD